MVDAALSFVYKGWLLSVALLFLDEVSGVWHEPLEVKKNSGLLRYLLRLSIVDYNIIISTPDCAIT